MKKNYFIALFLFGIIILSGCVSNQDNGNQNQQGPIQQNEDQQDQPVQENQGPGLDENFSEASLDDLEVGQQILVMGAESDDGSITAQRIMIGNVETNFAEIAPIQMRVRIGEENGDGSNNQNFQRPQGMPDSQSMSDEERTKFREQMMAERGGERPEGMGNFQQRNTGQTTARITGEIIAKDDESITIKLDEGGSKFVFFSDSMVVLKIKN